MLVLSRSRGERVIIDTGREKIVATVVEIREGSVRLGFEAPREVAIHREEVYEDIQRSGARSSGRRSEG